LKIGHQKYISELSNIIPISIQLLISDLVFPVYKIDHEKTNVSKERLKIPKRYSEAVVFENFLFIKCSEQKVKKICYNVVMSEKNLNV
jgi:hypothetical protein